MSSQAEGKVEQAVQYLSKVEIQLESNNYKEFMSILHSYKYNKISMNESVSRIKYLIQQYPDLIEGFNEFLPTRFKIGTIS